MTSRAKPLTARATSPPMPADPQRWYMLARDVAVFNRALEQMGYDMAAIVARSPLAGVDLAAPDRLIRCEDAGAIIGIAQQTRFTPNIAAEIARRTPIGAFPLVDYLVVSSDSVGTAMRELATYMRLSGNPAKLDVDADAGAPRVTMEGPPFSVEFSVALIVGHLRVEVDGPSVVTGASFRHQPDDAAAFAHLIECPVEAGAAWSGLRFDPDGWNSPLRRRDPILRQLLEDQARHALDRMPKRHGIAQETARVIATRVARGPFSVGDVARELAVSARTLQRRLTDDGVSFQQLVDAARKDAAGRFLRDSGLAISEVAYLLGYSEPAPFHRAFKRWHGVTPDVFRRQTLVTPEGMQSEDS